MSKFQIFQDGRAAGSAPVSGSDFVTKDYFLSHSIAAETDPFYSQDSASLKASASLATSAMGWITGESGSVIVSASYNSTDKKIYFYNSADEAVVAVDATAFIKDGMVSEVEVSQSFLVITFNTDAGREPVSMSLTQIFNPDNYYTKTDVETLLTTMSVGDVNVIEAIEFNGTASSVLNKTASINVSIPESIWVRGTGQLSAVISGSGNEASGIASLAIGENTKAQDSHSFAEGYNTIAAVTCSHAEGTFTIAHGVSSHAEGSSSRTDGISSHAEGICTTASANYSHTEGDNTRTTGPGSHAEGYYTLAANTHSHAEGDHTVASGKGSHAEGSASKADGPYSHAEGAYTTASGMYSHTEGELTEATNLAEHAQGRYNATASNQIFSVGVGQANDRRNAVSIITGSAGSASVYIQGVGGYDGTNPQAGVNDVATAISNAGLPAVSAADNGKVLKVVNGVWTLVDPVMVYSGSAAPSNAIGQDGDLYVQTS